MRCLGVRAGGVRQDGAIEWLRGPLALDLQYVKAVEVDPTDDSGTYRLLVFSPRTYVLST